MIQKKYYLISLLLLVAPLLCFSQSKHNWSVEQLEGPDPYYEKDRAVFETILFETNDFRFEYNKDWHLSFHEHSLIIHDLHSFISEQESFHLYLNDLSKCPTCRSHEYKNKTDDSILSSHKQFLIQEAKQTAGLVCDGCYSYCEYYKIDTEIIMIGGKKYYYWSTWMNYEFENRTLRRRDVEILHMNGDRSFWLTYSPYFKQPIENEKLDYHARHILESFQLKPK